MIALRDADNISRPHAVDRYGQFLSQLSIEFNFVLWHLHDNDAELERCTVVFVLKSAVSGEKHIEPSIAAPHDLMIGQRVPPQVEGL